MLFKIERIFFDKVFEPLGDRRGEASEFFPLKRGARPVRAYAGGKKYFVRIDVAYPRNDALIEKQLLYRPLAVFALFREKFDGERAVERLDAQLFRAAHVRFPRGGEPKPAEAAHVLEVEPASAREEKYRAQMRGIGRALRHKRKAARHAQMKGHHALFQDKAQKFSPAFHVFYPLPLDKLGKSGGRRISDRRIVDARTFDDGVFQIRQQNAPYRFNFGQFGHKYPLFTFSFEFSLAY